MANDAVQIEDNNPYITGFVVNYTEGDKSLERRKLNYQVTIDDILHPVKNYDNLSDIAYDYYKSSKWWWVLSDVNNIFDPFNLTPNSNIIIPDLDKIKAMLP